MKQLFLFVILLAIVGIVGFFYRATLEGPLHNTNTAATECQADALMCPDGSSVGRTGLDCSFAACPLPNVELPQVGISYVLPAGFKEVARGTDAALLASYEKATRTASSTMPQKLFVRRYPIPAGKDANSVMLAETMYETSGMKPSSMSEFKPVIINSKTYQMIVVERFEGMVHAEYYLPRETDVLRFEAIQYDVFEWTNPSLNVRTLPAVAAIELLLSTLHSNDSESD